MKFLDQVILYQKALTKKSRFYSFLMLLSGITLVAAAPFLSYEVSKIECHEKGNAPSGVDENEMIILKDEWERKDRMISDLQQANQSKDRELQNLIDNTDCEEVTRVIQNERDACERARIQLVEDIKVVETERDRYRDRLVNCETEKEEIINNQKDCSEVEKEKETIIKERDNWKTRYERCQEEKERTINEKDDCSDLEEKNKSLLEEKVRLERQLTACKNQLEEQGNADDCSKFRAELQECKILQESNDETISDLSRRLENCEKKSKLSMQGSLIYNDAFLLNGNEFLVRPGFDLQYSLFHNGRDVSKKIRAGDNQGTYRFRDGGLQYKFVFGRAGKESLSFQLTAT